jgi:hypothetical protein
MAVGSGGIADDWFIFAVAGGEWSASPPPPLAPRGKCQRFQLFRWPGGPQNRMHTVKGKKYCLCREWDPFIPAPVPPLEVCVNCYKKYFVQLKMFQAIYRAQCSKLLKHCEPKSESYSRDPFVPALLCVFPFAVPWVTIRRIVRTIWHIKL